MATPQEKVFKTKLDSQTRQNYWTKYGRDPPTAVTSANLFMATRTVLDKGKGDYQEHQRKPIM